MKIGMLVLTVLATFAAPAQAEWLRAKSRHFVIYSDTTPAELHAMAGRLERFDGAVRLLYDMPDHDEVAANPLTIYVAADTATVGRLAGSAGVAGFYQPRATGAVAFTPRRGAGGGVNALKPEIVLFHEYGHHLLLGNGGGAVPAWYSEGSAELVSTAVVAPDHVQFGHAANHRAYGLLSFHKLPITTLLAPTRPLSGAEVDQLYGRGWLLTHYAIFNKERAPQLRAYLRAFAAGTPPLKAAEQSFGDLKQLDRELDKYLRGKLFGYSIPASRLPTREVEVRPLSVGERALIAMRMTSERGVGEKTAGPLYARALKARVPADDAVAQGWLAEMAYDAGRDDEAEAAADRALAVDPRSIPALLYKARVHLRRAATAGSTDPKVWTEARSWIVRANRVDTNHAGALALFHGSFAMANDKPSPGAVRGIRHALDLMPQVPALRLAVAREDMRAGKPADARRVLMPLAYAPHAGPNNLAVRLIALIDAGKAAEAASSAVEAEGEAKPD